MRCSKYWLTLPLLDGIHVVRKLLLTILSLEYRTRRLCRISQHAKNINDTNIEQKRSKIQWTEFSQSEQKRSKIQWTKFSQSLTDSFKLL